MIGPDFASEPWFWMGGWDQHHGRGRHRHRHGPRWWAEAFGDRPPRAERGEIRYVVLDAISAQSRHGYEIIQHIEERASGGYRPSPGVIYPTLQMLEELGHARVAEEGGRKVYAITPEGQRDLDEHRAAVDEFYDRFDEEPWEAYAEYFGDLMRMVARLMKTLRKGARRGELTPETMRVVRQALEEALDKIEAAIGGR